ncbi:hypothetical protein Tco_0697369 [Tanacetum coccineum]
MEDEHLDTIPVTKSTYTIKSSVDDLVPTPSESVDLSDGESECDVPINDDSPESHFTTFSNPLFDSNDDFTSSDDESLSDEDEVLGELAHINPIPPGIEKADFDLVGRKETSNPFSLSFVVWLIPFPSTARKNYLVYCDTIFESLSPSPILVEDSDSLMEEIDLFLASDDSMPPGIEDGDYDSEGNIRFLKELLSNDSPPLPENESFSLDHFDDSSLPRPPPEPPDVEICFNFEFDAGVFTKKVVGDNSEHDVLMPNLLPTQSTLCPVFDLLLPFSSENEDKVFNPGIFSSPFSSHRAKITFDFSESPMMISGGDIPHLDVPYLHFYPP